MADIHQVITDGIGPGSDIAHFVTVGLSTGAGGGVTISPEDDLNTRLRAYLAEYYSVSANRDLTPLVRRYLDELSGDMMNRWKQLVDAADDAQS